MLIRQATLADISGVMQLIADVVPAMIASGNLQWNSEYPNPAVFEQDIKQNQLWVADIDGAIAGVAAFTIGPEPDYAAAGIDINIPAIVTHRLAVSSNYRGLGIAAALLNQAEIVARNHNIKCLCVDTNVNNQATQKLFPKLGYRLAGEINLTMRPGLSFYCYEKTLSE
jgi:ribosomal protein S18 acetylase RimI-like enzyme